MTHEETNLNGLDELITEIGERYGLTIGAQMDLRWLLLGYFVHMTRPQMQDSSMNHMDIVASDILTQLMEGIKK